MDTTQCQEISLDECLRIQNRQMFSAIKEIPSGEDCEIYTLPSTATHRIATKGVEAKILSIWHHVKYGWSGKLQVSFSKEPIWLLGECYKNVASEHFPATQCTSNQIQFDAITGPKPDDICVPQELAMDAVENQVYYNSWQETFERFRQDFYSRIWLTYRREFPLMNGSNYTSDCGWGCMLRSGQMLLAQGLVCHFLGRDWRYNPTQNASNEDNMHKQIIKWFGDSSSKASPFSIHMLVTLGEKTGKKPGDWYGPASISYLLRQALQCASSENITFDHVSIYVAKDCTIYIGDIEDEFRIKQPEKHYVPWQTARQPDSLRHVEQWKSVIIFIPIRLGAEKINPIYVDCLKLLLSLKYAIGIIGGRPKHSLYFVGFQEEKLINLDPHYCQEMIDVNEHNFSLESFHCKTPSKLKFTKMDPSCCIGFYCHTKTDFHNFIKSAQMCFYPTRHKSGINTHKKMAAQAATYISDSETKYPLFTFSQGRSSEIHSIKSSQTPPQLDTTKYITKGDKKNEEFVFL